MDEAVSVVYFIYILMLLKMVSILDKVRMEEVATQLRLTDESNKEEVLYAQRYFVFSKNRMNTNRKAKAFVIIFYLFSRSLLDIDDYLKVH